VRAWSSIAFVAGSLALASVAGAADAPGAAAPPAASPGATPAPAPAPAAPVLRGHPVVVIALGEGSHASAEVLAREVYYDPAFRAPVDLPTAEVLLGGPADPAERRTVEPARVLDVAKLRASLDPDLTSPATILALRAFAAERGLKAIIAVVRAPGAPGPRARIILVDGGDAGVELVGDDASGTGPAKWPGATNALRAILGHDTPGASRPAAPAPVAPRTSPSPDPARPGPTTAHAKGGPKAIASPADATAAAEDAFYERPWFWVALGAFTVAGVTALVVTQTGADEPSDSVRFRATIPQASFNLP